jgi:DNA polymerase-1
VNRVVLLRRGEGLVEVRECPDDGRAADVGVLPVDQLASFVAAREQTSIRWVWDDTTRWYPALLAAGVRVARCTDLRLCHAVLRRSPFVDQSVLADGETVGWDELQPVTATESALFPLEDPADRLDPVAEHARQRAALAASPERGRRLR